MPKNKNKQRLKNLLHAKKQATHQKDIEDWLNNSNPICNPGGKFNEFGYVANVNTFKINQNYDPYVTNVIEKVKQSDPTDYNPRDNRTLFRDLIRDENDVHQPFFFGLVISQKIVTHHNHIKIYLLLSDVFVSVQDGLHQFDFKPITDHLWIDMNEFLCKADHPNETVTVGIGDAITFTATVTEYRGYRQGINQTKYGVKDVIVMNAGYPEFKLNHNYAGSLLTLGHAIPYYHSNHYLIKYHDARRYPNNFPSFGDQIDPLVQSAIYDGKYRFGNQDVKNVYNIIQDGLTNPKFDRLIYEVFDSGLNANLKWIKQNAPLKPTQKVLTTAIYLKEHGVDGFYKELTEKHHWRYLTKNRTQN